MFSAKWCSILLHKYQKGVCNRAEGDRERKSERLTVARRIFNRALSREYCGATAEMSGMLMLLLIMQLCEMDGKQTHTQQRLRDKHSGQRKYN